MFDLREAYKQVSLDTQGGVNKGPSFEELKVKKKMRVKEMEERRREKVEKKERKRIKEQ